jgi:hypothetical protein
MEKMDKFNAYLSFLIDSYDNDSDSMDLFAEVKNLLETFEEK